MSVYLGFRRYLEQQMKDEQAASWLREVSHSVLRASVFTRREGRACMEEACANCPVLHVQAVFSWDLDILLVTYESALDGFRGLLLAWRKETLSP